MGSLSEGPSEELGSWEEEDSLSDGSLCEGSCEEEELGGAVGSWEEELGGSWLLGGAADSSGSGTVSYTHLDVYKRQPEHRDGL